MHGHATSGRSVQPHEVIRHSIEKVLNSPWMTQHLTWSSTRHREAKGVYTSRSLSSNSYGLVVWIYELVVDWSNVITEWSKPSRKELRVGRDQIRTGRIEIGPGRK